MRRSPRLYGLKRSRWWLDGLRQSVAWLGGLSLPGVHKILCRLKIRYKRGRRYVHSPDPSYNEKLAQIQTIRESVAAEPKRFVMVYEDELTYYRRPTVAQGYAVKGVMSLTQTKGYIPTLISGSPPVWMCQPVVSFVGNVAISIVRR